MNYLDIILSIPLLLGLYKGLKRGIIKELASLLALTLGIYVAVHFSEQVQPTLQANTSIDESFLPIIAFAATFIMIVLLVRLLGLMLDKIIKLVALGMISGLLGGFFGLLKTAFIISALLLIFNTLDYHLELIPNEQKKNSLLYQPISEMVPLLLPEVEDGNSLIKDAEKVWQEAEGFISL
ncbi:MAG: colicin V production protein [Flavobacteriales bacterium]|nr:colicin V production protein [Flavobacteriales bacterium]|tara:strand:- start:199 stop:741 length:543 start_codon:yes stop_codon:yes gene_type:complete